MPKELLNLNLTMLCAYFTHGANTFSSKNKMRRNPFIFDTTNPLFDLVGIAYGELC